MKIEINIISIKELLQTVDSLDIQKTANIDSSTLDDLKQTHDEKELLNKLYSLDFKTVIELQSSSITWKNNLLQKRKSIANYILNDIKTSPTKVHYYFLRKGKLLANEGTENIWFAFKDDFETGECYYGTYNDLDPYKHVDSREFSDEEIIDNIAEMLKYSDRYEKIFDRRDFLNQFKIDKFNLKTCIPLKF